MRTGWAERWPLQAACGNCRETGDVANIEPIQGQYNDSIMKNAIITLRRYLTTVNGSTIPTDVKRTLYQTRNTTSDQIAIKITFFGLT